MEAQRSEGMNSSEFREFFIEQLQDVYWAEQHFAKTLQKLSKATTSGTLADAFETDARKTDGYIKSIERVFELLGESPKAKRCEAMEGLIKEAGSVISDTDSDSYTRDAGLILAAQKAEHYGIASFGTLRIFAGHMGEGKIKNLLENILDSKKDMDRYLTEIAEDYVNELAVEE